MVASLEKVGSGIGDSVDQSALSGDPPGPDVGTKVLERLWFPDSSKGVPANLLHEPEDLERHLSVGADPVLEILHALVLDDGSKAL